MTEINQQTPASNDLEKDWDDLVKADAVVYRTGVDYIVAKQALEAKDFSILGAISQIEQDKKDRRTKYLQDLHQLKNDMENTFSPDNLSGLYDDLKYCACKPVDVAYYRDKKCHVPAGIIGAGLLAALYPFHRSKAVSLLSGVGITLWFLGRNSDMLKARCLIKQVEQEMSEAMGHEAKKQSPPVEEAQDTPAFKSDLSLDKDGSCC